MGNPGAITIFRSRLRDDAGDGYGEWARRMNALAREMAGFVSFKVFEADDGERVSIIEFESADTSEAWREHPEHLEAQRLGRERFYAEYSIQVCEPLRAARFRKDEP